MDLKERIVVNSTEMFIKRGCKTVTMDDIATENGISKRTLYEIFEDKSSLLKECIKAAYVTMRSATDEIFKSSENVYQLIFKTHECKSDLKFNLGISFLAELKRYYPDIHEQFAMQFSKFHAESTVRFLKRGQEEGLILKCIDANIVTQTVIGISNMLTDEKSFSNENMTRKQVFKETVIYYIRGISTLKGIKYLDNFLNIKYDDQKEN